MDHDSINKLLNRDDVYSSNDWVSGLYLEEFFRDEDPRLWQDLLASWSTDTTNTLWFYQDGKLQDLNEIVNESGGRFSAFEVALELGNVCIRKAPLVNWLKKRQDSATNEKRLKLQEEIKRRYKKSISYREKQKKMSASLISDTPDLIELDSLLAQWRTYNITAADILRLGVSANLRLFVKVRYVSITFGVSHEDPFGDSIEFSPEKSYDIGETRVPFQVSKESITSILDSRDTPKMVDYVQLIYPNNPDCYSTRIETNCDIGLEIREILKVDEQTHLAIERSRTIDDLWIAIEDVKKYKADLTGSPKTQGTNKDQFKIPAGTEWSDIKIKFKDENKVLITVGKNRPVERTWENFNCFNNKRSKKMKRGWFHLLALAIHKGKPPMGEDEKITRKHIYDLQKNLKQLFPNIQGKPFNEYSSKKGWAPNILLSVSESLYMQQDR